MKKSLPFLISKIPLEPGGTVATPSGEVLYAAFDGDAAYAWVKHQPEEEMTMQLLTLPTGGPYELETDERFFEPEHVAAFHKTIEHRIKVANGHPKPPKHTSTWFVFAWKQKPVIN